MTILLQVLEQGATPTTPWPQRKFAFVNTAHIVGMRLDGQNGVWLDLSRPHASHQLARTAEPEDAVFFLLAIFDAIAACESAGGSWIIGHDGVDRTTIFAGPAPSS